MKKLLLIILTVFLLAVLCACAQEQVELPQGFSERTGGTELTDVNIKDMNAQLTKEGGTIELSFVKGSRENGGENSMEGIPKYRITVTEKPRRLRIDLEGVAYWDFYEKLEALRGDFVTGYFDVAGGESGKYSLYLQLAANVEIWTEESDASLKITMRTVEENDRDDDYFVILNSFEQYQEGLIGDDLGLTPTYASEMNKVVMISSPIEDMKSAEELKAQVDESIASSILGKEAYIEELFSGQLPVYDSNADQYDLETRAVMKANGEDTVLPWAMENGVYLTTAKDGSRLFYRTVPPNEEIDSEPVAQDVLIVLEATGKLKPLSLEQKFYGIEKAEYSVDGKYLAVLDSTEYGNALYVIELSTGQVRNMGEEGLGINIADFAWSENGAVIYAMSGNDVYQLNQCDFSGNSVNISAVEEQQGYDSEIGVAGGKLYFSDGSSIYQVDVSTGTRAEFVEGMGFKISPDKKYMAVKTYTDAEAEISTINVSLVDIATGRSVDVVTEELVECTEFTGEGDSLYVSYSNNDEGYGYTIASIPVTDTGNVVEIASLSPQLIGDCLSSNLYIIDNIPVDDGAVPITYEYAE